MHEESIKELATRVCRICNKPIGSNESDIEKYLENSVHVACFYESDLLQNETIQKIAIDTEAAVSQASHAWQKWSDDQLGDWCDVSHSESFYAGYEACEKSVQRPDALTADQLTKTQAALKQLYHAVVRSMSVNDPLGMAEALDEAGRWF